MTLEELKTENTRLHELIKENVKAQQAITRVPFVQKWGADVGDTIEFIERNRTYKGVVKEIRYDYSHNPQAYCVALFNKSGLVGDRVKVIYSWTFPSVKVISKAPRG